VKVSKVRSRKLYIL